jgi:argininosuccinate synthase
MPTQLVEILVGDTIMALKGRVGFEAAAPLIIIKAHHLLEKHTLGGSNTGKNN